MKSRKTRATRNEPALLEPLETRELFSAGMPAAATMAIAAPAAVVAPHAAKAVKPPPLAVNGAVSISKLGADSLATDWTVTADGRLHLEYYISAYSNPGGVAGLSIAFAEPLALPDSFTIDLRRVRNFSNKTTAEGLHLRVVDASGDSVLTELTRVKGKSVILAGDLAAAGLDVSAVTQFDLSIDESLLGANDSGELSIAIPGVSFARPYLEQTLDGFVTGAGGGASDEIGTFKNKLSAASFRQAALGMDSLDQALLGLLRSTNVTVGWYLTDAALRNRVRGHDYSSFRGTISSSSSFAASIDVVAALPPAQAAAFLPLLATPSGYQYTWAAQSWAQIAQDERTVAIFRRSVVYKLLAQEQVVQVPTSTYAEFTWSGWDSIYISLPDVLWSVDDLPALTELANGGDGFYASAAAEAIGRVNSGIMSVT